MKRSKRFAALALGLALLMVCSGAFAARLQPVTRENGYLVFDALWLEGFYGGKVSVCGLWVEGAIWGSENGDPILMISEKAAKYAAWLAQQNKQNPIKDFEKFSIGKGGDIIQPDGKNLPGFSLSEELLSDLSVRVGVQNSWLQFGTSNPATNFTCRLDAKDGILFSKVPMTGDNSVPQEDEGGEIDE